MKTTFSISILQKVTSATTERLLFLILVRMEKILIAQSLIYVKIGDSGLQSQSGIIDKSNVS